MKIVLETLLKTYFLNFANHGALFLNIKLTRSILNGMIRSVHGKHNCITFIVEKVLNLVKVRRCHGSVKFIWSSWIGQMIIPRWNANFGIINTKYLMPKKWGYKCQKVAFKMLKMVFKVLWNGPLGNLTLAYFLNVSKRPRYPLSQLFLL